jgi:hypothetical protein
MDHEHLIKPFTEVTVKALDVAVMKWCIGVAAGP